MYKNFVEILCDPVTKEDLNLEDAVMNGDDIVEGKLVSKSNTYLISNSIANLPDIRWSYLDTFDNITPSFQSTHNAYEIQNFFKEAGFIDGKSTNW